MKALIDPRSKRVAQIVANPKVFEVAPPLVFVDAPAGVTTAHGYVAGAFVPPQSVPVGPPEDRLSARDLWTILKAKGVVSDADLP